MINDHQLLDQYARHGDEDAFRELIDHHVDLVYSTALRQVNGDVALAKDVTQKVFTDLARKAASLPRVAVIAGWLYEAARFAAANALRGETRRKAREKEAVAMHSATSDSTTEWENLVPVLDAAMAELSAADRDAVLLRYFRNQDFHSVGNALGVSDDAAQKRVGRAVERLRGLLEKRGVTIGAQTLGMVISAQAVQAAPAGLSALVGTAAFAGTTVLTTTATVTNALVMSTTQKVLITVALAVAAGTGIYEARQARALRAQVRILQATGADHTRQMTAERDEALQQLAVLREERDSANRANGELVKLRGDVTVLRRERDELLARIAAAVKTNAPAARTPNAVAQDVDTVWVRKVLDGRPGERGAAAGALRGKQLRGETNISPSEIALRDALQKRRDGESLERSPAGFAEFQAAFIQEVVGISDPARVDQVRNIIEKTYEHAVANGLDIPSKPASDADEWVQRRFQLDRRATTQLKQLFTEEERSAFNRAFLGVMGADLGVGVDKSNYPKGFLGP